MAQPQNKNPLKDKMTDDELDLSISNYTDKDVPVKDIALLKRATKLDLSNNKLTGLPKSFASLTHLVKIDLSCNIITELPSNFGELHRLKHLDLYNNKLSHLPLSFHQLTSLRWLDLKNNPLSVQLAEAAGECLNPRECEQCARRVVQFMGRVKEHYDQERLRRQQHEKELMDAKLAVEEAEKERLRLEKKAKKEQKKQELRDRKKIEDIQHVHVNQDQLKEESPAKPTHLVAQKMEKPGQWSPLAKVNVLLLLTVVAMVGGAVYVHTGGDVSRSGLHSAMDSAAANLATLSALVGHHGRRALDSTLSLVKHASVAGTRAGDVLVRHSLTVWAWSAERAADVDRYLTDSHGPAWSGVKATVGDAWRTGDEYARLAGQKALAAGAHAARGTWEVVEAGGAAALEAAGPLWETAAARGTAVKAGVLEAAARLRRDAGPTLLEWAAAGQRAAADGLVALQRDAPGYAAAVWAATWRAGSATWNGAAAAGSATWQGAVAAWQLVAAATPVYTAMVADQINRLVAAVTGG